MSRFELSVRHSLVGSVRRSLRVPLSSPSTVAPYASPALCSLSWSKTKNSTNEMHEEKARVAASSSHELEKNFTWRYAPSRKKRTPLAVYRFGHPPVPSRKGCAAHRHKAEEKPFLKTPLYVLKNPEPEKKTNTRMISPVKRAARCSSDTHRSSRLLQRLPGQPLRPFCPRRRPFLHRAEPLRHGEHGRRQREVQPAAAVVFSLRVLHLHLDGRGRACRNEGGMRGVLCPSPGGNLVCKGWVEGRAGAGGRGGNVSVSGVECL